MTDIKYLSLRNPPDRDTYTGYSYEAASMLAVEICRRAVETGQTINASLHLDALREIMQRRVSPEEKIKRLKWAICESEVLRNPSLPQAAREILAEIVSYGQ